MNDVHTWFYNFSIKSKLHFAKVLLIVLIQTVSDISIQHNNVRSLTISTDLVKGKLTKFQTVRHCLWDGNSILQPTLIISVCFLKHSRSYSICSKRMKAVNFTSSTLTASVTLLKKRSRNQKSSKQ